MRLLDFTLLRPFILIHYAHRAETLQVGRQKGDIWVRSIHGRADPQGGNYRRYVQHISLQPNSLGGGSSPAVEYPNHTLPIAYNSEMYIMAPEDDPQER